MDRIDSSETQFTPPELNTFLTENKLGLTFTMLSYGITNYLGRTVLLKEKTDQFKTILNSPLPPKENLHLDISKIHCQQLDILSSVFMFLEDFLAYSFNLGESLQTLQKFPIQIASENIGTAKKEIDKLRNKKKSDIAQYLLFPDIGSLPITMDEKRLLRDVFNRIAKDVHNRIQNIIEFYDNYYRVYIKYKHVLTAIIGLHQITDNTSVPLKKTVSSHIYVRDCYKRQFKTHIIACNHETLTYYEQITSDIRSVFELLIISYLHYLMNYGKRVVIPISNYVHEDEIEQWKSIILKTNKAKVLYPKSKTQITISGELSEALLKILPKKYIYTKNADIFGATP